MALGQHVAQALWAANCSAKPPRRMRRVLDFVDGVGVVHPRCTVFFSAGATFAGEFDANTVGDVSRYTLRGQDGSLRPTSSDLKLYHGQIEAIVGPVQQGPTLGTTLINASLGGAVIAGFSHMGLAACVARFSIGSDKQVDAMLNSLRTGTLPAEAVNEYKELRLRKLKKCWGLSSRS